MPKSSVPSPMQTEIALNRNWAESVFTAAGSPPQPAVWLWVVHEDGAGDTKVGRCAGGGPLRLGDQVYTRGIGVNSLSILRLALARPAVRFRAVIGLDRNVDRTPASVDFHLRSNGRELFATEVMRAGAPPREIDLPLAGVRELDLVVDVGGDDRNWDQADWAEARVLLEDGSEIWLDDLARQVHLGTDLPFSFVYEGRPSSDFLHSWPRTETVAATSDGALLRTVTFTDPETGLQVRAVCTIYTDTPGVDWTVHFTNTGDADTPVLEQVHALDTTVTVGIAGGVVVHRLNGAPCRADDWLPFDQELAPGERLEMAATHGRSSNVSPFFALDWGTGGVITAIGWSGQWSAAVDYTDGRLRTLAGMERIHLRLRPGETVRSPRIMQLYWSGDDHDGCDEHRDCGDFARACNLFRRTMVEHVVPRADGRPCLPPIAYLSTAFYELNRTDEVNVRSHLEAAQGLGFEVFWLDAYWTGPGGFPDSMGNYGLPVESVEPADRFPHGLASIGTAVRQAGLDFLMWFEPERVAPNTRIAREHPEWVLSLKGDGSGLLDLGLPAAREAITAYLDAAIRHYQLTWLRIDYNIDPLRFWRQADDRDPDRVGMAEIRYVEGLYRMWDDLRQAHPGLLIDNCASGGRRIDLETCSRSVPLWRSDNTCDMVGDDPGVILAAAIKNQLMSVGLNRYVPFSTVGQMGTSPYLFRSGFNAGIAFCQDVRPAAFPRDLLRQAIAEAGRIRPFWLGDFYPLTPVTTDPRDWCVLQYHRPEEQDGIVLAFRRHESPFTGYECQPRGVLPEAAYRVTISRDYEPEPAVILQGEELLRFDLRIGERPGSVLVEYRRIDAG